MALHFLPTATEDINKMELAAFRSPNTHTMNSPDPPPATHIHNFCIAHSNQLIHVFLHDTQTVVSGNGVEIKYM